MTTDQSPFSHFLVVVVVVAMCMISQPHDSADETTNSSFGWKFFPILDTKIFSPLHEFLHGDSDENSDQSFYHTENRNRVSPLYGFICAY